MNRFLFIASMLGCAASAACVSETADDLPETSATQQGVQLGVVEANDLFGFAVATGDFDGDGKMDLAVGAPGERPGSSNKTGSVLLYRGTVNGLQPWTRIDEADLTPILAANNDEFGFALASANIDHDSFDDLVIGAPNAAAQQGGGHGGVVYVLYGSANGLLISTTRTLDQASLKNASGNPLGESDSAGDRFGATLAVNTASPSLLAIGAPGETLSGGACGFVNVLKANGRDFTSFDTLSPPSCHTGALFGKAIVIKDLDNDGHREIAVGQPNVDHGQVLVYPGTGTDFGSPIIVLEESSLPTSNSDAFGSSLAVGNFDAEKYPGTNTLERELVIAAPGFSSSTGRLFTYRPVLTNNQLTSMKGAFGFTVSGSGGGARNGDGGMVTRNLGDALGLDDIIVGAPGLSGGKIATFRGAIDARPVQTAEFGWSPAPGSDGLLQSPSFLDAFPSVLALGDFNGDGQVELIAGMSERSNHSDTINFDRSGAFYMFPGGGNGTFLLQGTYFDEGTH